VYSTYVGGTDDDFGGSLTLGAAGNVYVTGTTFSIDFPTTPAVFQGTLAGDQDAFVTKVNSTGTGLEYSSYLGGSSGDGGQEIALDTFTTPNAYVTGFTTSSDFPTTPGAFQSTAGGNFDAFVTKIAEGNPQGGPFMARVTGGGTINVPGGIASFSFMIAQSSSGVLSGHLQYFNHASGSHVRGDTYTSLVIVGNTAVFDGACTVNGTPCTFTVHVIDNGEPGTTDSFTISVSNGPAEGGVLRSGNILIHQD
jgi:hypothetical protein